MNVSLESGQCPNCAQENSVHIDQCHNCKMPLPWAGSAATKIVTQPVLSGETSSKAVSIFWQVLGCVVCAVGLFLWIGNMSGIFPTVAGIGFIAMAVGGAILNYGIQLMLNS